MIDLSFFSLSLSFDNNIFHIKLEIKTKRFKNLNEYKHIYIIKSSFTTRIVYHKADMKSALSLDK